MASDSPDVFVSYNRNDQRWAEWIAWVLEEAGYQVVIQAWDFRPGGNFVLEMDAATKARHTVAVLSPSYLAAQFTHPEWAAAFAKDPQGENKTLIPIRVEKVSLTGLLSQVIYVDLVDLSEAEAHRRVLASFAGRAKPASKPSFPGGKSSPGLKAPFPRDFKPEISLAKLPATGETFVARDNELTQLDAAWANPRTRVIQLVAAGGVGKSALVNHWLDRVGNDGWRGAERVLGWSFYSQGTEATGASGDQFVEFALGWLGYDGPVITSPWAKGEELARRVRSARTLLVLDGLEPLQFPPGENGGRLKDPAVRALLRELQAENAGLCVVTTRVEVADVVGRAGVVTVDLETLPKEAGAALLKELGVRGREAELEAAAVEFGGHALALTLLGTYLRDVCDGDVRRRREVELLAAENESGAQARRVMRSYEAWLGEGVELQVLRLVGLFDRPAEAAAVKALRAAPIAGLTVGLGLGEEPRWRQGVTRLVKARLVSAEGGGLDAHPLVREYFGERLRSEAKKVWKAGHLRLYEHYEQAAQEFPETLEAMMPLYTAVVHGCRAGRTKKALVEIYRKRIQGDDFFSFRRLGAPGMDLTALSAAFDSPWSKTSSQLNFDDQLWLLNSAGLMLMHLGRLSDAIEPLQQAKQRSIRSKAWRQAAVLASHLCDLRLELGGVAAALKDGAEAVRFAERCNDHFQWIASRTAYANALHQAGSWEGSAALFGEAENIEASRLPFEGVLNSLQGYQYCDLLLGQAELGEGEVLVAVTAAGLRLVRWVQTPRYLQTTRRDEEDALSKQTETCRRYRQVCEEVRDRAETIFAWRALPHVNPAHFSLLDIALDHLTLGRAQLGLALTSQAPAFSTAALHLDQAVAGLRQAGAEHHIPRGLLARAALHRFRGDFPAASADLAETLDIARRGHMRLFETDAHLEWTRLALATDDRDAALVHLEHARVLVDLTGYERRRREVEWLERRLAESPEA